MKNLINAALLAVLAVTFAPASPVAAQDAQVNPETELKRMAADAGPMDGARDMLRDFLSRPAVEGAAESIGVDAERLRDGVNTLSDSEAAELAERIQNSQDQEPMAGGDTFVVSSTVVIVILLVAILVAVA